MTGETRTSWDYSERVIWWYLDSDDIGTGTLEEIKAYLNIDKTKTDILNLAIPTTINYDGTECKT